MMDRVLGPQYRRAQVRDAFTIQLVPPIVGAIRLGQEVMGLTPLDIQRGTQLGLVILLTVACLKYARASRPREDREARASGIAGRSA
jgi:hypothetical protein